MPDRTRTQPRVGENRPCDHCGTEYTVRKPRQRFHSARCRAAAARERQAEGLPGRMTAGPRRVRDGWSITIHLPDLPPYELGDELRIKQPPPEIDLPEE